MQILQENPLQVHGELRAATSYFHLLLLSPPPDTRSLPLEGVCVSARGGGGVTRTSPAVT